MTLSAEDLQLLDWMKQREFNLKKRQRAANAVYVEMRRYRSVLIVSSALAVGLAVAVLLVLCGQLLSDRAAVWHEGVIGGVVAAVLVLIAAPSFLSHSRLGSAVMARKERELGQKYSGDLHAGRRWAQFYYRDEDISAYIRQVLYMVESEKRFDSVAEAVAFAREHRNENPAFKERGLELFNEVVAKTDLVVVSSSDDEGRPSSRFMRFVRTSRPGIWYITSAPHAPKVREFDLGRVAIMTSATDDGATISSNQVSIRRAGVAFNDIAYLYREQIPRYLDGMTEEDQRVELVYELRIHSAKVDSWVDHDLVVFDH